MKNHRLPPETPPNSERLRFSVRQMLLATTAIAVYLGLLRWVGPLAFYFAAAVWVGLLFKQLDPEAKAAARLAAQIFGGVIMPLSILFLARTLQASEFAAFYSLYISWVGGLAVWVICQFVSAPRLSALMSGFLTVVGGIFLWLGSALSAFAALGPARDTPLAEVVYGLFQMTGCVIAGFVAALTYFAAAVQAWRKSRRNFLSWLLVFVGMVLAICLPIMVLRLA